ncbi:MAG: phosphoglycerate kinase, partial [Actinomycetota bacterium]|nr:phosphoglycerate kinase [Actinomycetota bacterium]
MPALLTPGDLPVAERPVLLRADLNVPLEEGKVADDFRIRASLPAIEGLREAGAVVVLCSHLGRPKGPEPSLRMDPVAERLAALAGWAVRKLDAVVGPEVAAGVAEAAPGDVLMLENTRFESGETRNDPQLVEALAALAQYFVLDAFGSAHRAHASTVGVAQLLPSAAGS